MHDESAPGMNWNSSGRDLIISFVEKRIAGRARNSKSQEPATTQTNNVVIEAAGQWYLKQKKKNEWVNCFLFVDVCVCVLYRVQ